MNCFRQVRCKKRQAGRSSPTYGYTASCPIACGISTTVAGSAIGSSYSSQHRVHERAGLLSGPESYRPTKAGERFSKNAVMPLCMSSVEKLNPNNETLEKQSLLQRLLHTLGELPGARIVGRAYKGDGGRGLKRHPLPHTPSSARRYTEG